MSDSEEWEALKVRVFRRMGRPDDGLLRCEDAMSTDMLTAYSGKMHGNDSHGVFDIEFESVSAAAAWCESITVHGGQRDRVRFRDGVTNPYGSVVVQVQP